MVLVACSIVLAFAPPASVRSALGSGLSATTRRSAVAGPRISTGWPCPGCILELPASYRSTRPTPLLVVLHGDEGAPAAIASVFGPVTADRDVIMFAPQCPTALGCRLPDGSAGSTNSWWGWLQYSPTYDDSWLGRQIARIEGAYDVDRSREYLLGWSGGADYLGWYALEDSSRFAGAAFVAGGVPYHPSCPTTHLAAYFLLGSADPRYQSGQPLAVKSILARCGDPTKVVVIPGASHTATMLDLSTRRYAAAILDWLMAHRRATS